VILDDVMSSTTPLPATCRRNVQPAERRSRGRTPLGIASGTNRHRCYFSSLGRAPFISEATSSQICHLTSETPARIVQQEGRVNRARTGLILISLIALTLSLTPATQSFATPPNIPSKSTAQSELNTLVVASEGSMTGYSRDLFPHWSRTTSATRN